MRKKTTEFEKLTKKFLSQIEKIKGVSYEMTRPTKEAPPEMGWKRHISGNEITLVVKYKISDTARKS
jgi:hypothetical protein